MSQDWPVSPGLFLPLAGCVLLLVIMPLLGRVPLTYNLRNLVVRWRTTTLTALAFTCVVGLLTIMLAFVNGMNQMTEGSARAGNVVVLSNGADDEVNSNLTISDAGEIATLGEVLRDSRGQTLCSKEVYVGISQPMAAKEGGESVRRILQFRGIEDPIIAAQVHEVALDSEGTWFSDSGVRTVLDKSGRGTTTQVIEAVVGEAVASELGVKRGDVFEAGPRQWVVVGIMRSTGSVFGGEIWAKRQLVGSTFGKEYGYTTLVLKAKHAEQFADYLSNDYKKVALNARTEQAYYSKLASANEGLSVGVYLVTAVIAVGGVFGVMNTMFAAISYRVKDIAVLRILGFFRWQVLVSFLAESLVLAFVGGLVGCAVGLLCHGRTASTLLQQRAVSFTMLVDGNTLAIGMLFALGMGLLGGLIPSLAAMRVKPLEAMR